MYLNIPKVCLWLCVLFPLTTHAQKSFFWGLGSQAGTGSMAFPSGTKTNYLSSGGHLYFRKDFQEDYRDFLSVVAYPGVWVQPPLGINAEAGDTLLVSVPVMLQYSYKKEPANYMYGGTTYVVGVGLERIQKLGGISYFGPTVCLGFRHFIGNQTYELQAAFTRDYHKDSRFFSLRFTLMFGHD